MACALGVSTIPHFLSESADARVCYRRERVIELEIQDGRLSTPLQNFRLGHTGTKPRA